MSYYGEQNILENQPKYVNSRTNTIGSDQDSVVINKTASYYPEPPPSSIGETNLLKRSYLQQLFNLIALLLSLAAIILEIIVLYNNQSDIILQIILLILAIITLLISIVDFKTGDCECLRNSSVQCYGKTSIKLLLLINTMLWAILFYFDLMEYLQESENSLEDMQKGIFVLENDLLLQLNLIKILVVLFGFVTSVVLFMFKVFRKIMFYVCGCLCQIICGILCGIFIIALCIAVLYTVLSNVETAQP